MLYMLECLRVTQECEEFSVTYGNVTITHKLKYLSPALLCSNVIDGFLHALLPSSISQLLTN